jgi:putative transposase
MGTPRKTYSHLRHGWHCTFALDVYRVFVTKYLRNVFKKQHLVAMHQILGDVCQDFETELVEFNGEHDHVHMRLNYPPKAGAYRNWSPRSRGGEPTLAPEVGEFHPWFKPRGVLWSPSYFAASCGGAPIEILKRYIEQQQAPH